MSTKVDIPSSQFGPLLLLADIFAGRAADPDTRVLLGEAAARSGLLSNLDGLVDNVLGSLTLRERKILQLRYGLDGHPKLSLAATGREFGIGGSGVGYKQQRALKKLRRPYRLVAFAPLIAFLGDTAMAAELESLTRPKPVLPPIPEPARIVWDRTQPGICPELADCPDRLEVLGLNARTYNALIRANLHTVGEVASVSEDEIFTVRNIGRLSMVELRCQLDNWVRVARADVVLVRTVPQVCGSVGQ